jgi:hypothetical protein
VPDQTLAANHLTSDGGSISTIPQISMFVLYWLEYYCWVRLSGNRYDIYPAYRRFAQDALLSSIGSSTRMLSCWRYVSVWVLTTGIQWLGCERRPVEHDRAGFWFPALVRRSSLSRTCGAADDPKNVTFLARYAAYQPCGIHVLTVTCPQATISIHATKYGRNAHRMYPPPKYRILLVLFIAIAVVVSAYDFPTPHARDASVSTTGDQFLRYLIFCTS